MADKKIYTIEINGIKESTSAVEALIKTLNDLEAKIKVLENQNVKVNTGSATGGGNSSQLNQEAAVQKEINKLKEEGAKLDAKIAASQTEVFQKVDATKQLYKETLADQKAMAAQERLYADAYSNTMQGMKSKLADLKAVINTTDLGDTDQIEKMTKDAGELTKKLKEMEEAYGQFGRNVGNYKSATEDLGKYKVQVGDTTREFNSAKEAARTLSNELLNLPKGAKGTKELHAALLQVKSDIQDINKSSAVMDNLLDTMESFAAIGTVSTGLSSLFGFDDGKVEEAIKKMVAFQNVLKGIETLNKQIQTQEGIGGWIAKGNAAIDSFVGKITGANKAQEALNKTTTAGATASKGLAAAETAQATATAGATVATKALSVALKSLGIGLIIAAVAALIEYWEDIYDWFTDTIPALKNLTTWFDKIKSVAVGVGTAIINYMVQPLATLVKVIKAIIEGNFSEVPKIIANGIKDTFNVVGNFQKGYNKETERQQKAHNAKMLKAQKESNEDWIADEEAKYGKSYTNTKKYLDKQMELVNKQIANSKKGSKEYDALIKEQKDLQRKLWENERTEKEKNAKKSKELAKKNAKEEAEVENELIELKIANMDEGLNKELKQLEHEKNQRLAKVRANGIKVGELSLQIEELYAKKENQARKKHAEETIKLYSEMWSKIRQVQSNSILMGLDADITKYGNELESKLIKLQEKLNSRYASYPIQYPGNMKKQLADSLNIYEKGSEAKGMKENVTMAKEYLDILEDIELAKSKAFAYKGSIIESGEDKKAIEESKKALEEWLEIRKTTQEEMEGNLLVQDLRDKGYTRSLSNAYKIRIADIKKFYNESEELQNEYETKRLIAEREILDEEFQIQKNAEYARFNESLKSLENNQKKIIEAGKDFEALWKAEEKAHIDALKAIEEKANSESEKLELEHQDRLRDIVSQSLNGRIQEYRDFYTAIGNLENRQPEKAKGILGDLGIINIKKSRENYQEALDGYKDLMQSIQYEKNELQKQFDNQEISFNDFQQAKRELNDLEQSCSDAAQETQDNLNNLTGQFIQGINQNVQQLASSFMSMMNSIWDYQDYMFDKEQAAIDEQNKILDKKLSEQEELIEKHKTAVDAIEDELSSARGDRRQHLIDQLNAEIDAQRRAQKEEQRIQKEKEAQEKKEEELEKKRRQEEYKRNVMQAFVSWHLGVANALATQPFMPLGIAMGALATVLGAAQYALVKSQKPYANGGQLEGGVAVGNRHRDGGIPVLGGRASIEGGEFITNRLTTAKNIELLEFINSKKKRVDVSDLIEFYGGNSTVRKNIQAVRTKFEDGGTLPTLRTDIDISNRLVDMMEDYSKRPVQVAVVDIIDKTQRVNDVKVMAGL